MKNIWFLLLLFSFCACAQDDRSILIFNAIDSTILLIGFPKDTNEVIDYGKLQSGDSAVKLVAEKFELEVAFLYSKTEWLSEGHRIYLPEKMVSRLLKSSGVIFGIPVYGDAPDLNREALSKKYGFRYEVAGCVYRPGEFERGYEREVYRLLEIRNGKDWEVAFKKDKLAEKK